MPQWTDLAGMKFGRLTAKTYIRTKRKPSGRIGLAKWLCDCDCGTQDCEVWVTNLRSGYTQSCGCLNREAAADRCRRRRLDLTGRVFGRLKVVQPSTIVASDGKPTWECLCRCGKTTHVKTARLTGGVTTSCGCFQKESASKRRRRHGLYGTSEYNTWQGIKRRCLTKDDAGYPRYGGRGIKVCEAMRRSVESFVSVVGHKPDPTLSLDRKDPDGHYSCGKCPECVTNGWPLNCRWATDATQGTNRRNNVVVTINGVSKTLMEWCREYSTPYSRAASRIRKFGWDPLRALTTPGRKERQIAKAAKRAGR